MGASIQEKVERALGMELPDDALVQATRDGGIIATQRDGVGTTRTVEVDGKGNVYYSTYCSGTSRSMTMTEYYYGTTFDGRHELKSREVPACRDHRRVSQGFSVGPDKLARARAIILGPDKPVKK